MKALVILAVIALVSFALWQKWRRTPPQTKQLWGALFGMAGAYRHAKKQRSTGQAGPAHQPSASLMLPCARCGLHILEEEGVKVRGQFYCTAAHSQ